MIAVSATPPQPGPSDDWGNCFAFALAALAVFAVLGLCIGGGLVKKILTWLWG